GARLLAGGSAAAGAAVLALAAVACAAPLFLGLLLVALLVVAAGGLVLGGVSPDGTAAVLAVLAVMVGAFVPAVSFRLSGLRLPALPRNAEELQENIDPFPSRNVLDRATVADGYLTAFYLALGVTLVGCLTLLGLARGWAALTMVCTLAVLLLLHGRAIGSIPQRLAMLLPGAYGLVLPTAHLALHLSAARRPLLLAGLLLLAAVLAMVAWTVPGRRLLPYWGRAADLLHTLTAIAVLPLALDVVGLYHVLRAVSG
ncbi:type VII secretion integral membrane protein EccD, partial [Kitasatospora sp. LaBMicrA B282]|uniref:type VII secretion integral membrane protein EccD n=1 Tax=Kitasatospora sp. LaBMicrA B282 TaxID=3420949 RepID=UPI003D0A5261